MFSFFIIYLSYMCLDKYMCRFMCMNDIHKCVCNVLYKIKVYIIIIISVDIVPVSVSYVMTIWIV